MKKNYIVKYLDRNFKCKLGRIAATENEIQSLLLNENLNIISYWEG